ncbi:hypothetical protein [Arthrobacter sp. PM3]|uniref:hypothetical protein n=1 Tax=Arthrobacter sp. PM3 TaxID=2017685 RepID=UPI000E103424|nr:hypothetical protein [Arthrobacter sp. PM3]AXJ08844.1 hypothetical protein CFN17_03820 [Arthrobacter sp. PM3]
MKTKTAFALSLTGILLTGSAALAANTQTLNGSSTDVASNADTVFLKNDAAGNTPTASPVPATTAAEPGDDKGGLRSPEVTRAAEPGDDKGGHGRHGGHGSDD